MKFAKRAQYWWDRWQRGMAVLVMIGLGLVVCTLAASIPFYLIAALLHDPSWEPGEGVIWFAVLILIPFFLTDEGLRYALRDLYSDQEKAERERREGGT